jgi:hypothetical protein
VALPTTHGKRHDHDAVASAPPPIPNNEGRHMSRLTHYAAVILKAILVVIGLAFLFVAGCMTYLKLTTPATPKPPFGYENRAKYDWTGIPGHNAKFNNVPMNLWFGKRNDQYDTTHFRLASDYLGSVPIYHGEYVELNVVWPSLRSIAEEEEIRKKNGQPSLHGESFKIVLSETSDSYWGTDKNGTGSVSGCDKLIRDDARHVEHCNTPPFKGPNDRKTSYWPLNKSIRTPYYHNRPAFHCTVNVHSDKERFDQCFGYFSYNADLNVEIQAREALAVEILADFPRLIQFLQSLEVKS